MDHLKKPIILLSTPRSGSTPMYQIWDLYLSQNRGVQGVEEILNPYYARYWEEDGQIKWERGANSIPPDTVDSKMNERFLLAKRYYGKIFFKVFPSSFRHDAYEWLVKHHDFVTHERSDLLEQVLSYLVSHEAKHWYSEKGLNLPPNSLNASITPFKAIEASYFHFLQLKRIVKPLAEFKYEDFISNTPTALLRQAGFYDDFDESKIFLTKKQTNSDKLELFKNKSEILKWYKDSFFQQLKPII